MIKYKSKKNALAMLSNVEPCCMPTHRFTVLPMKWGKNTQCSSCSLDQPWLVNSKIKQLS